VIGETLTLGQGFDVEPFEQQEVKVPAGQQIGGHGIRLYRLAGLAAWGA
jgi:hypothetical protein